MNRAERRRLMHVQIIEGGPKVEAVSKFNAPLPPQLPGQHMWVYLSMFRCADPKADRFYADLENLLIIEGPSCYWCAQPYSAERERLGCSGQPS